MKSVYGAGGASGEVSVIWETMVGELASEDSGGDVGCCSVLMPGFSMASGAVGSCSCVRDIVTAPHWWREVKSDVLWISGMEDLEFSCTNYA